MSDSKKAYAEMQEENKPTNYVARDNASYIFVLDCEAFLYGAGHKVNDCEWMVTTHKHIETDKPM